LIEFYVDSYLTDIGYNRHFRWKFPSMHYKP